MNEAKESPVSGGEGEAAAPEGANPASGCLDGGEGRDDGVPALTEPLPQQVGVMKVVMKRILIAAALFAVCVAILASVKAYGVWVLSGIALVLFVIGLLRKDKKPAGDRDGLGAAGDGKEP